MMTRLLSLFFIVQFVFSVSAFARGHKGGNRYFPGATFYCVDEEVPSCEADNGRELNIMNNQVLEWKFNTQNLFQARARVRGEIVDIYPDRNGHYHFSIQIGNGQEDTLEVVFSKQYGQIHNLRRGMTVEACGDYITSNRDARYPASPDGALIHWIHRSNTDRHKSGYVVIEEELVCGYYYDN